MSLTLRKSLSCTYSTPHREWENGGKWEIGRDRDAWVNRRLPTHHQFDAFVWLTGEPVGVVGPQEEVSDNSPRLRTAFGSTGPDTSRRTDHSPSRGSLSAGDPLACARRPCRGLRPRPRRPPLPPRRGLLRRRCSNSQTRSRCCQPSRPSNASASSWPRPRWREDTSPPSRPSPGASDARPVGQLSLRRRPPDPSSACDGRAARGVACEA